MRIFTCLFSGSLLLPSALLSAQSTEKVPPHPTRVVTGLSSDERDFWNYVKDSTDPADFEAYLKKFPKGFFADLARNKIKALTTSKATPVPIKMPAAVNIGSYAGQTWSDPVSNITLCWIPAGSFDMGSANGDADEKPVHRVTLTKGFWMGKMEVTQAQWQDLMGSRSFKFPGGDRPAEQISWDEAQNFIRRLNAKWGAVEYRLPTEAEWEYACRAGSMGDGYGELTDTAWYYGNSGRTTHSTGQKQANAWGLQDMLGNVWEWCADWYGSYSYGPDTDPVGPSSGLRRVSRGGSWSDMPMTIRSTFRGYLAPDYRYGILGFRVVAVARKP